MSYFNMNLQQDSSVNRALSKNEIKGYQNSRAIHLHIKHLVFAFSVMEKSYYVSILLKKTSKGTPKMIHIETFKG